MAQENIVVLGSGMAGFGAAHRLHAEGIAPVMFDKNAYHGGHTASFRYESGFLFDVGPHISFTKDSRIQELFADSVDQQYETIQISLNNYWRGYWPKHPVQLHLHGLPEDIVKVITDFVEERQAIERPVKNYADWLLAALVEPSFILPNAVHGTTTTADNMSTDWLGPRIYRPSLEELRRSITFRARQALHHPLSLPTNGGFTAYLSKFVPKGNLRQS